MLDNLLSKIYDWSSKKQNALTINGVNSEQWSYILRDAIMAKNKFLYDRDHIIVCPSNEHSERIYEQLKNTIASHNVRHFPGLDVSPYTGILSSERNLIQRFRVLNELAHNENSLIICSVDALAMKLPPKEFFLSNILTLSVSDIISPLDLAHKLLSIGYQSSHTVEEPGTFSRKGEIFDIFPISHEPIRIQYFDDMIEEIFQIDRATQRTKKEISIDQIFIGPAPQILVNQEFSQNLRQHIPMPPISSREKLESRKRIFALLSDQFLFDDYPAYCPLFFEKSSSLLNYFNTESVLVSSVEDLRGQQSFEIFYDELCDDFNREEKNKDTQNLLPHPDKILDPEVLNNILNYRCLKINEVAILSNLDQDLSNMVEFKLESTKLFFKQITNPTDSKQEYIRTILQYIKDNFSTKGQVIFTSKYQSSHDEFKHLLEAYEFSTALINKIKFEYFKVSSGFYYQNGPTLLISDGDLFSTKSAKARFIRTQNIDLFAEQLATLKENDFVVHNEHGVGVFLGLESLTLNGLTSDYLVIEYTSKDKIYVPVYKINTIQKHADSSSGIKSDSLRTGKFLKAKEKARSGVKKLAFDLLKLQAKRNSALAYGFSPPDHEFNEFELAFPFEETPDQTLAISEVIKSMQKTKPMDFLVCGDVGFGKTEVAMRAAYKAILDHKQVAILVPTTILALQHYNSFKERFRKFAVSVDFLSRFKTSKEAKKIKSKLAEGKIDIIIGTHALLSEKIKYRDLGLVVVDEEQRFGVGHKEKLKLLKSTVDFLTLTATPIPRTLQLAFLGIRDLALIKTAPPRRQSIKTYLIKDDAHTIKVAIEKELSRGGQVFVVHNKVNDMEQFVSHIRELVPTAKIVFAHGQMPEKELEDRIRRFYANEFQILVATTIIESGLDIPNANTMIIDRADTFGLAQLHQLRGRIGRSDKKAYAYFVIPNNRSLSEIAEKRLKALQTYADMGSGFNIATCDLEIRGAGDILGGEQTGHIGSIGLELYMGLLKEAINEIQGNKKVERMDIEISTPHPAYIPNNYIHNSSERLKTYKRLSNSTNLEQINYIEEEFLDIYGAIPAELNNLIHILKSRVVLKFCGLKSVQVTGPSVVFNFDQDALKGNADLRNNIVEVFLSQPKIYQFTPEYRVMYSHGQEISPTELVGVCQKIAEKIVPS
ncbi:MAG: transcription-repair coupling factor [Bacteriovoracaceae bacterium]|jgi:transcription-repair coupling factor (superfamily II helicase)|nr:transcription-repair coupling factor [Bacteriovoracaceae bacterium]